MVTNKLKLNIIINCSICKQDKSKYIKDICSSCYDKEKLRKRHENSPMIPCACNCGTMIHAIGPSGKPVTRVNGHCDGRKIPDYESIVMNRKPREKKIIEKKVRDQVINCKTCLQENKKQYVKDICEACYSKRKRMRRSLNSPLIKCQCKPECQEMIRSIGPSGEPVRVKYEHKIGEGHTNFKGGFYYDKDGYVLDRVYGKHPYKDANGYVKEHRLVYEHYLSIMMDEQVFLPPDVIVHHINEVVDDNRLINLEPKRDITEHIRGHNLNHSLFAIPMKDRQCLLCDSKDTYKNSVTGKPIWYLYENRGYICKNCYLKNLKIKKNIKKD